MENLNLFGCLKVRGGIFIGVVSLVENFMKGGLSVLVLVRNGFIGMEYKKLFDKEKVHAEIYILLSVFGIFASTLLINGSIRKSSGKVIWWICFQGISIFHQIYFSFDVVMILAKELHTRYLITVLISTSLILLGILMLEIYFMLYIVELYQIIAECEIENDQRVNRLPIPVDASRNRNHEIIRDVTDRNNPMQSSIIKLLNELESNNESDTARLIDGS